MVSFVKFYFIIIKDIKNRVILEIKKLTTELSLTSEELQMLMQKYVSATTNGLYEHQQRMENGLRPNVSNKI